MTELRRSLFLALAVTNVVSAATGGLGEPFVLSHEKTTTLLKVRTIRLVLGFICLISLGSCSTSNSGILWPWASSNSRSYSFMGKFSGSSIPECHYYHASHRPGLGEILPFRDFFQTWPISCNPRTNYPVMYVCSSVTEILLDISILGLPAQSLKKLRIDAAHKALVTIIFGREILYVVLAEYSETLFT